MNLMVPIKQKCILRKLINFAYISHVLSCYFAGVVFIEYAKSSEALTAMEEMNGKYLENYRTKALKVLISQEGNNKTFKTSRPFISKLFVNVDKNVNKFDLKNMFRVRVSYHFIIHSYSNTKHK